MIGNHSRSEMKPYQAIVIGVSAGGMHALTNILPALSIEHSPPVIVVQHVSEDMNSTLAEFLDRHVPITVVEAIDKAPIENNTVYIAPPGYHLLIEEDWQFSLSVDARVNFARPSIDVLFESAADIYTSDLVGVILTGNNTDGVVGLKKIKTKGGFTIVQEPSTAEAAEMPRAAIDSVKVDQILPLKEIGPFLSQLNTRKST